MNLAEQSTPSFLLNEIHTCLQGEGIQIGRPSLLVRFQICNLRCAWCDTSYTHTYKSDSKQMKRFLLQELIQIITDYKMDHIIFTGGEPTLQNIGILAREIRKLSEHYSFEVETNGTRIPHKQLKGFLESDYALMQWNISPKFENANEKIIPEALAHWAQLAHSQDDVFFKFVIRKTQRKKDMNSILSIIQNYNIPKKSVLLMAEGTTQRSQLSNIWLHDLCLQYGFRLTPRLHILIFGAKRGV